MNVHRLLSLAEWGFNVPRFIHNARENYGRDAYLCLKEIFQKTRPFCLVATHTESGRTWFLTNEHLHTIVNTLNNYNSHDTLVMEMVESEFAGCVIFSDRYEGGLYVDKKYTSFKSLYGISDVKLRHIVRELDRVREKLGKKQARIDYVWATDFVGVLGSRLVVFDYKIL